MSLNILADLDSFYQQQPDINESKVLQNDEDWGEFQGSQCLRDEKSLSEAGKPFVNIQTPRGKPRSTELLFDAADELHRDISTRGVLSEPKKLKFPIMPNKDGSFLSPVTEYERTTNTKEQSNDLSLIEASGSKISEGLANATETNPKHHLKSKAVESPVNEEEWADFTPKPVVREEFKANELIGTSNTSIQSYSKSREQEVPPTNVPPPALILTLFLQVISESKNELQQLTKLCQKQNVQKYSAEEAEFLRAYVEVGRVLARVIAGRKLRWKRDQILSQGMKIGPASLKRVSGMKLAGIDKTEMGREDKEVLDIVEVWREQLGRLRSIIAAFARSGFDKIGSIPDIQLNIPVKALKESEGGLSSTQPCALCGLKRNERVHRIDANVHDSFGEWWIESMNMHRTCKYFWQSHKSKLQSN